MRRPRCVRDASDRTWHESHWIMFMSLLLYTSMQIGQYCFCANLRPHGVHISYPLYLRRGEGARGAMSGKARARAGRRTSPG